MVIRINMKYVATYAAGVATAPVWVWVFRKPLAKRCTGPFLDFLADEDFDETLFRFMQARMDVQEKKKKEG